MNDSALNVPELLAPVQSSFTVRAKFAFQGQRGEMSFKKDDVLEVLDKESNGWWLVKKDGKDGWAPSNYLEEIECQKTEVPLIHQRAAEARHASLQLSMLSVTRNAYTDPTSAKKHSKSLHVDEGIGRLSLKESGTVSPKDPTQTRSKPTPAKPSAANKPTSSNSLGASMFAQSGIKPGHPDLAVIVSI